MILDDILERKRQEVQAAQQHLSLRDLKQRVSKYQSERSFKDALTDGNTIHLISELKRKSPSKGMLRERFDPVALAQEMQEAGAHALSVLTDEHFFGGSLDFLRTVKQFTDIPALRKDFIIDPYQIYQAAAYQADAILLLVCALNDEQLNEYIRLAASLGMDALVEIHADDELQRAIDAEAQIIGINHRDLKTFEMDMQLSERLMGRMPAGKVIVAESGIHTAADVARMQDLGAHALLIGESLMVAENVGNKIQELFGAIWAQD